MPTTLLFVELVYLVAEKMLPVEFTFAASLGMENELATMYSSPMLPTSLCALSTYVVWELDHGIAVPALMMLPVITDVFERTD